MKLTLIYKKCLNFLGGFGFEKANSNSLFLSAETVISEDDGIALFLRLFIQFTARKKFVKISKVTVIIECKLERLTVGFRIGKNKASRWKC